MAQYHHITSPNGEAEEIKCPHCKEKILLIMKTLEMDDDEIIIKVKK